MFPPQDGIYIQRDTPNPQFTAKRWECRVVVVHIYYNIKHDVCTLSFYDVDSHVSCIDSCDIAVFSAVIRQL